VEKVNLGWIETSGSSRHGKINRGNNTHSSLSWHFIGFNLSLELEYGSVAENKGNFFLQKLGEIFKFWNFTSELLFKISELFLINAF
jgi:hypothetical protein